MRGAAEVDFLNEGHGALLRLLPGHAARNRERERHIMKNRLPGEKLIELLEYHHPVGTWPGDNVAIDGNRAFAGLQIPADRLQQVDFPQPDGPSTTNRSDLFTSKLTLSVAVTRRLASYSGA